jgi:hypothetical protein
LNHRTTIRKLNALILLIIFSLSAVPKQALHKLLANHRDSSYLLNKDKAASVGLAVINCHAENPVVESVYVDHGLPLLSYSLPSFQIRFSEKAVNSLFLTPFFFELRGPPAIV